mgnify:CR=1 FL=1
MRRISFTPTMAAIIVPVARRANAPRKLPIESLKKRILAAVLCASMLAGSFAVDGVVSYYNRDEASADELESDADIIQDEDQSGDDFLTEDDQNVNDSELSDTEEKENDKNASLVPDTITDRLSSSADNVISSAASSESSSSIFSICSVSDSSPSASTRFRGVRFSFW